jgi:hypothetical protein
LDQQQQHWPAREGLFGASALQINMTAPSSGQPAE